MLFSHSVSSASMIKFWRFIGSVAGPDGRVSRKWRPRPQARRRAAPVRIPISPAPPARCGPGVRPVDAAARSLPHARPCELRRTTAPCPPPAPLPPRQRTLDPPFALPPAPASDPELHPAPAPPPLTPPAPPPQHTPHSPPASP